MCRTYEAGVSPNMESFIAVRSYSREFTGKNISLNTYLAKGYSVILVTPFVRDGNTEYLEYILKAPQV